MTFVDGAETGGECPKCGKPLVFEMSFTDQFSYSSGHYTTDRPLVVCPDDKCGYFREYDREELEE